MGWSRKDFFLHLLRRECQRPVKIKKYAAGGIKNSDFSPFIMRGSRCAPFPIHTRKKEFDLSKRKRGPTIVPYLSAKADNREKRFIQVGNSLLLSRRFHALSTGSRFLYFCMAMESGGRSGFVFPQREAKKYGIAPSSLRKHINELEAARFIRVYSGKPTREPNRYEFCVDWKLPPTSHCSRTPMAICSRSVSNGNKETL